MVRTASRSFADVPLTRDGHDALADGVVGGVEGEGELGADGLGGEGADGGLDAGGGDGHAGLGDADGLDEQADGGHEGVVVEEGLAHAHEDEVDAGGVLVAGGAGEPNAVAVEDGGDLTGDLARGEVAANAELGGKAELAVDGAADLAGDADGGAAVAGSGFSVGFFFGSGLAAVAALATVAVRHPDGFDGFAVGEAHEVALGAVYGAGGLDDLREADGVAGGGELVTECGGEDGDLVDGGDTLAIEGFEDLAGTVGLVAEAADQGCELGEAHAEEGLRRVGGGGGHLRSV